MRTTAAILLVMVTASFWQTESLGQCRRGGSQPTPQIASAPQLGLTGFSANSLSAIQLAALQRTVLQQQLALQQSQSQLLVMREQQRQARLARRREAANERRAAELARREVVRANLRAAQSQRALVAFRDD